jgi:tryptophan-rich sensory protein
MPLFLNILIPVALAGAVNALIYALGWTQPDTHLQPDFAPPGWVIGLVWVALFALMGAARYYAGKTGARGAKHITRLIFLCLAYPFYTAGLQDGPAGLIGIVLTEGYTLYCAATLRRPAPIAAALLIPLVLWLAFAFVLVIAVFRLNG